MIPIYKSEGQRSRRTTKTHSSACFLSPGNISEGVIEEQAAARKLWNPTRLTLKSEIIPRAETSIYKHSTVHGDLSISSVRSCVFIFVVNIAGVISWRFWQPPSSPVAASLAGLRNPASQLGQWACLSASLWNFLPSVYCTEWFLRPLSLLEFCNADW